MPVSESSRAKDKKSKKMNFFKRIFPFAVLIVGAFHSNALLSAEPLPTDAVSENTPPNDRSFEIDAWAWDRGNFSVFLNQYRNGGPPMIAGSGTTPHVEYDIPFPAAGKYWFSVFAAIHQVRPLIVFLDGREVGRVCTSKTSPTWNTIDAIWDDPIELTVSEPGKHTLKIVAEEYAPHLVRLRFQSENPFPEAWKLSRPRAKKLLDFAPQFQGEANLTATAPNAEAMRRAIEDLIATYQDRYPRGKAYLERLDAILANGGDTAAELEKLRYEALFVDNPVIDFETLLFVRRHVKGSRLGFPANFESNSSLPKNGYDDEIMTFAVRSTEKELQPFYKPPRDTLLSDLDLEFDGDRLMFSAVGENNCWNIFEIDVATKAIRQLTKADNDVDFYDSCYLPDGRIITTSTAPMVGVPCVGGLSHVANLFLLDPQKNTMRQLCFDQEHNWSPSIRNNGDVLYARWEYADTPHSNSRLLFHCNPDGTSQLEYYGSNSYWPNTMLFAKAIPNHPTKVVCIVAGHHQEGRVGELVILDPGISRHEAEGAVQRLPGYGKKVEATVADGLTRNSWPKFVHPYPLSDKHFLVAAQPTHSSLFGIYFIDVFDNMILLKELPENALLEPIPLRASVRPPVIADRVNLERDDALIFVSNVLEGPGLEGIPPGTVKALKVFTYHYSYHNVGGLYGSVGQDGPWDVRGVLGTVPVEEDGSAHFRVPANLAFGILPLDENGQAIQIMRSWMTAMPGENLHCNGCHEPQGTTPPPLSRLPKAMIKEPSEIESYRPLRPEADTLLEKLNVRGFYFKEEVQPILDRYCVSCHDGEGEKTADLAKIKDRPVGTSRDGRPFAIDLRGDRMIEGWFSQFSGNADGWMQINGGRWTVGYDNLQRFVRRPGIESDYGLLVPMEFAANTTELVQLLKQGHYDVELDADSWNRLLTWIDMNTPYHGSWSGLSDNQDIGKMSQRRLELASLYGGTGIDFEGESTAKEGEPEKKPLPSIGEKTPFQVRTKAKSSLPEFEPFSAEEARKRQTEDTEKTTKQIDLGDGLSITLRRIPAYGKIEKPFWIGEFEITNEQFRRFDPSHDSRWESRHSYQFGRRGHNVDGDALPVVRVSWNKASAFCQWLSRKTSLKVDLPSEEQWEYACRAGTSGPFWFGDFETDFSPFANMGDLRLKEFVSCTADGYYTNARIIENPNPFDDRVPKDERFDDDSFLQTEPGRYEPNAFGLYDMHGNVTEWTRSDAECPDTTSEKVVRGGSWYDRPYRCTSDYRLSYPPYQPVFNVGFRIAVEE